MRCKPAISSENFEVMRWPYYLILPMSWILVLWTIVKKKIWCRKKEDSLLLFDGIGKYGKVIKRNVTGWKAVDLIYNHRFREDRTLGGRLDDFWFNSLNCQAARNRFRLAKKELEKAIAHFSKEKEIRVASLAAGTGQIEIETIAKLFKRNIVVKAVLIDKEEEALKRANEYILQHGMSGQISAVNVNAARIVERASRFRPHVVQMIAFLDYFNDKDAIAYISKIRQALPDGGYFIASNTMPNVEMHFVKWVVGWPLIYRNLGQIEGIVKESGFKKFEVKSEPLHIQGFVIARK